MTSRDFCYWLQGFFEIVMSADFDEEIRLTRPQVECVTKHLALVFKHEIDPTFGDQDHQDELNKIHNSNAPKDHGHGPGMRC